MAVGLDAIVERETCGLCQTGARQNANTNNRKINIKSFSITQYGPVDMALAGQTLQANPLKDRHPMALVQGTEVI